MWNGTNGKSKMTNLKANKDLLQVTNRHIHFLEQGILPPELEKQGLEIFKTREAAIVGMLKAKKADKESLEHIISVYEGKES